MNQVKFTKKKKINRVYKYMMDFYDLSHPENSLNRRLHTVLPIVAKNKEEAYRKFRKTHTYDRYDIYQIYCVINKKPFIVFDSFNGSRIYEDPSEIMGLYDFVESEIGNDFTGWGFSLKKENFYALKRLVDEYKNNNNKIRELAA